MKRQHGFSLVSLAFLQLFTSGIGSASPIDSENGLLGMPSLAVIRDTIKLPMDRIFNQRHSMYCWAYSSYHTLRTYYLHAEKTSSELAAWKNAVTDLNDPSTFRRYLDDHFNNSANEPMTFVRGIRKHTSGGLSNDWTSYFPFERTEFTIPFDRSRAVASTRSRIAQRILTSLKKGAPSAFCGNGHCTTIYGVTMENGEPKTYLIADSVADGEDGRSYDGSARKVLSILEIAMTLR
jgi:hypothetical protein